MKTKVFILLISICMTAYSCLDDDPELINTIPNIVNQSFSILENEPIGTLLGTVLAYDADGDLLTFSITSGNEDELFLLNNSTGKISLNKTLNYEAINLYNLEILVADQESSTTATISIIVEDVDDNELVFMDNHYTFISGLVYNYGNSNPFNDFETELTSHSNYDFVIADDEFVLKTDEFYYSVDNATIGIYVEFFAPNTDSFIPGTFEYKNLEGLTKEDVVGDFFFKQLNFLINPDSEEDEVNYLAISGNVVITENAHLNYTLTFNIVVQEIGDYIGEFIASTEQTVSFSYTGDFNYSDLRIGNTSEKTTSLKKKNINTAIKINALSTNSSVY